jgi:hypothetical protein
VNAGSIAERDLAADRGGAGECFCAGCEAIVTAADGYCKYANRATINRELRQGKELPLLSAAVAVAAVGVKSLRFFCRISRDSIVFQEM